MPTTFRPPPIGQNLHQQETIEIMKQTLARFAARTICGTITELWYKFC